MTSKLVSALGPGLGCLGLGYFAYKYLPAQRYQLTPEQPIKFTNGDQAFWVQKYKSSDDKYESEYRFLNTNPIPISDESPEYKTAPMDITKFGIFKRTIITEVKH